ncbi:mannose-6-phosphate isomerase, class I, partial [Vibrio parahaemolyticus]|nr:mannose-6-phosphate isomerase, class I [Vibrio parahaemolyticus]
MKNLFFKLENTIQNYSWGSRDAIKELFGIENPDNSPQAEIWMGAHPNGCSRKAETHELLSDVINQNKVQSLGNYTKERFGELPFLFKVLAAEMPLSIQVHPSKSKAEMGFARENEQGIPLNAANRNYKDPNHKPELVYALTFYKAMNGFRPIEQILTLFEHANITTLRAEISALRASPNSDGLKGFFSAIMSLEGERKQQALEELYTSL